MSRTTPARRFTCPSDVFLEISLVDEGARSRSSSRARKTISSTRERCRARMHVTPLAPANTSQRAQRGCRLRTTRWSHCVFSDIVFVVNANGWDPEPARARWRAISCSDGLLLGALFAAGKVLSGVTVARIRTLLRDTRWATRRICLTYNSLAIRRFFTPRTFRRERYDALVLFADKNELVAAQSFLQQAADTNLVSKRNNEICRNPATGHIRSD